MLKTFDELPINSGQELIAWGKYINSGMRIFHLEKNSDGETYNVDRIAEGVVFHNGLVVTMDDSLVTGYTSIDELSNKYDEKTRLVYDS